MDPGVAAVGQWNEFSKRIIRSDIEIPCLQHHNGGSIRLLGKLGLNLSTLRRERRRFAFACPDWTERRPHLGGSLGAALWAYCVERGWMVKQQGTRAIIVTDLGKQQLWEQFGVQVQEIKEQVLKSDELAK